MFNIDQIQQRLEQHKPSFNAAGPNTREAAVAIVLCPQADQCDVLFIKRATREGDPWSGHMAFPGGHREPDDPGLMGAAMRETSEEIGLLLEHSDHLGPLDHQIAQPRGRTLDMLIAPHVFRIDEKPKLTPNYEVADTVWAPLHTLAANSLHTTETFPMAGRPTVFNGYRLAEGHFVWGLTYRILKSFFAALDPNWRPPQEID